MKISKVITLLFLGGVAVGVELGLLTLASWQNRRYHQRLDEQAEFSARPSVTFSGTFLHGQTFALTNQPNPLNPEAEVGWRIFTPLQTASGTVVVDRGYMPPALKADGSPDFSAGAPTASTLSGIMAPFPQWHGWLHGPDTTTHPRLLAFLNPALMVSGTQSAYVIARISTSPNVTAVPPPLVAPTKHLSYALQWLGMAIAFPMLCLFGWLRNRRANQPASRP